MRKLTAIPVSLKEAQAYINKYHRHHKASVGDKFRVACSIDGEIVGIAQCGNPVARYLCDGETLEITRLCTNGEKDVCSFLYSRCARIAKELGYKRIITYILETETGVSLKASGFKLDQNNVGGATWENNTRARERRKEQQLSMLEERQKYPVGVMKQRWVKYLNGGNLDGKTN